MPGIVEVVSLILALIAAVVGLVAGRVVRRADPSTAGDEHVVRLDIASATLAWGVGQGLIALIVSARFVVPAATAWLISGLAAGLVLLGLFGWKLRQARRISVRRSIQARSVTSDTWQHALLGAGSAGFVAYLLAIGRIHPQLAHLGVAVAAALVGYAVGLALWSPKLKIGGVRSPALVRSTDGLPRRHSSPPARPRRRRR